MNRSAGRIGRAGSINQLSRENGARNETTAEARRRDRTGRSVLPCVASIFFTVSRLN
uniref:Uncharacterized protein n=1 Tax=Arundo donax TaxID=35708 RepID=A0A0A8YLU8_ARUDO